jgi:hypothetical protein
MDLHLLQDTALSPKELPKNRIVSHASSFPRFFTAAIILDLRRNLLPAFLVVLREDKKRRKGSLFPVDELLVFNNIPMECPENSGSQLLCISLGLFFDSDDSLEFLKTCKYIAGVLRQVVENEP